MSSTPLGGKVQPFLDFAQDLTPQSMRQSAITSAYRRAYANRFGCRQCGLGQARRTQAVMFTGSTEVARRIAKQLAGRLNQAGQPIPLVAETGGLNVMVVDSSALASTQQLLEGMQH